MDKLVENAQMLARATRAGGQGAGPRIVRAAIRRRHRSPRFARPKGMDSSVIVKEFRNRFGSIIANGQGTMKGQIFRIAHLGYFDFSDLFAMVAQLEIILAANGVPVEVRERRRCRAESLCGSRAASRRASPLAV